MTDPAIPDDDSARSAAEPPATPAAEASRNPADRGRREPLIAALVTTAAVTALSYAVPDKYAATAVGMAFLAATWWLVLRRDETTIRAFGLAMGGLLEPVAIAPKRFFHDALVALFWVALLAAIVFPPFWFGYRFYWHPRHPFVFHGPTSPFDEIAGQVLVIALPEEAFYRGYLQTALDAVWPPRWRVLGADLGPGWLVSALVFAVGHVLTTPHASRLAVFFPALLFGWLRARTRGVGAGVAFHATCNLLSATLARGYGLTAG